MAQNRQVHAKQEVSQLFSSFITKSYIFEKPRADSHTKSYTKAPDPGVPIQSLISINMGNTKLKPCCTDRAVARSLRQG